eukprot:TRINITY_DN105287_c0_g1_i1.p1 TRINITY_DN105287_c0_g1~~TRINITY_DN105287_c0_g1_i1.p1  ORF type:complete len:482 (+),score=79.19 TRINITY_DN105287_c0_g1_i1:35-1447(+)
MKELGSNSDGLEDTAQAAHTRPRPKPSRACDEVETPTSEQASPQLADGRRGFYPDLFFQAWRLVIRPPRSIYPKEALGPENLRVLLPSTPPGTKNLSHPHWRQDLRLRNRHGHILECSHFQPMESKKDSSQEKMPCIIYCHGSSSCRIDAFKVMPYLLQYNVTLFCLDFSGSGLSDGDYVTLGYQEQDDLSTVIDYLSRVRTVSSIGLWGKSMGAVAALMRTARDRRVDACVLDSPFSDFRGLVVEAAKDSSTLQWIPKSMVEFCLSVVSEQVEARAGFNPLALLPLDDAPRCLCPAIFGSARDDRLVPPHQVQDLSEAWGGDSKLLSFDGDHNSDRPLDFLESAARFIVESLTVAAETDEKMSQAINSYFHQDDSKPGPDVGTRLAVVEERLLGRAVSAYVERVHGMEAALEMFVQHGSTEKAKQALRQVRSYSGLMPDSARSCTQCTMSVPPGVEGKDNDCMVTSFIL